jgi:hypothetical protein
MDQPGRRSDSGERQVAERVTVSTRAESLLKVAVNNDRFELQR